jgi:SAM-dependent methyltransferase
MAGLERLPRGARVLDFACGRGRHARAAAQLGLAVTAVDRDPDALADLDAAGIPTLETLRTDLESDPWPFEAGHFDALVVCNYLYRPRLDALCALLSPGGLLIYETFAAGNERYGRPTNPDYLLKPGELLDFARRNGLHVLAYEDGFSGRGRRARIQRLRALLPPLDLEAFALE